ncbi:MAG: hypothetical protein KatS3mg020_0414 [Fimbriimonadales bacterium]|nr:MAG: hypothetical protein KatS3mg020_0414 [Fimbriimonadales bacterium]
MRRLPTFRYDWRATIRLALRSVMTLVAFSAASLTPMFANPFSVTVRSGPGVTFIASTACEQPLKNSPFSPADFAAAQGGAPATVLTGYVGPWIASLPADQQAQWIAVNQNRSARSILFAQRFELPCRPIEGTATLTFHWAVDDRLGDPSNGPNPAGVYINGVALPISGGGYTAQTTITVAVPASLLNAGANYLYVYVRDLGCGVSGVLYSATMRGLCPSCTLDNEQPWNKCLPSTPSAVIDCAPATPTNFLVAQATDDFIATYTGAVNTVEWWGTLSHPSQRFRPFQIAFYPQDPNCRPPYGLPLFSACVIPHAKVVGVDCEGRRVWHFSARLPAPYFQQVAGQKYWLMITEIDSASIRPGQTDFQWSGHAACNNCANGELVCNCRAIKFTVVNGSVFVNPVVGCNGEITDLAWALRWRTRFHIHFSTLLKGAITVQFRIPGGAIVEEHALQVEEAPDGYYAVLDTGLPEGEYEAVILTNGALPKVQRVHIAGDGPIELEGDSLWGDLNMDGVIDDGDLLTVLFNFGAGQ